MKFGVVTLFPDMFAALHSGITGRALTNKLATLQCFNPRDEAKAPHYAVDDKPYGGGPGMVMQAPPLAASVQRAKQWITGTPAKVIYVAPTGKRLTQQAINTFATMPALILVAGRYEGVDQRFIDCDVDEVWSLGDYVLSGGELAVMAMIDAIIRLLPGSLGDPQSAQQDSFMQGVLDYPHYTRPAEYADCKVPNVLLSGDHQAIANWRRQQALGQTWLQRPDLLAQMTLNEHDQALLRAFQTQQQQDE